MKPHEMREMTAEELQQQHDSLIDELVNIRIKLAAKQLDNPLRVRELRKEIARCKSILREKELGAQPGQTLATLRKQTNA
jgi:large subunit ribosomal protein L29